MVLKIDNVTYFGMIDKLRNNKERFSKRHWKWDIHWVLISSFFGNLYWTP